MNKQSYLKVFYLLFSLYIILSLYNAFSYTKELTLVQADTDLVMSTASSLAFILFIFSIILVIKLRKQQKIVLLLPLYHIVVYIAAVITGVLLAVYSISQGIPKDEIIFPASLAIVELGFSTIAIIMLSITVWHQYIKNNLNMVASTSKK